MSDGQTLGGVQFWTDRRVTTGGWRLQRHAWTGHYRVVDSNNVRRASGSRNECLARLPNEPATAAEAVLLLHGLSRTRRAMGPLATALRAAGFDTYTLGYASTRASVASHARALGDVIGGLPPYRRVHAVAHSLGNLVIRRHFLRERAGRTWGRMVMLAPPNCGSILARRLNERRVAGPVLRRLLGTSGLEIARWDRLASRLADAAALPFEVLVLAAQSPVDNPFVGVGDLVVSVDETRLAGCHHETVRGNHTLLMRDPLVMQRVATFLKEASASR